MARKKKKTSDSIRWPDGKAPAAIYARVSSDNQDVENSVDAQVAKCREWGGRNGYVIVRVFIDRARSGRASNRPDFQEMLDVAGNSDCDFQTVLVWRFSRFYRDRIESAFYKERLRKNGVSVVSINEPVDDSAVGRFTEGMLEAVDGFQSDIIGEDVRRGTRNLASAGFFLGSAAPYGMIKVEVPDGERIRNKLSPDPLTASNVRRLFDLALEEKTEGQITTLLNNEGIPNASGGRWKSKRVHDVLTNPHYAGTIVWGQSSEKDDPVITPNAHPGIVTQEEFDRVQALLQARAPEVANPRNIGSQHLLSGLVKCRQCGANFTYAPCGKKVKIYRYLVCNNRKEHGAKVCDGPRLSADKFEPEVMDTILEDILVQSTIGHAMQELRNESGDNITQAKSRLNDIEKRLKNVMHRQDRIFLAYEKGEVSLERYAARNRELEGMKYQIEAEQKQTMTTTDERAIILENPTAILAYTRELATFLRTKEYSRCKPWLKSFVRCIWIEPGRATIQYKIPLPEGGRSPGKIKQPIELLDKILPSTRLGPHTRG